MSDARRNNKRRKSFEAHVEITRPVPTINQLAEKRAALRQLIHAPPSDPAGCIQLPVDDHCPRSFGNRQQLLLSSLLTSYAFGGRVHAPNSSLLDCHGLMQFNLRERLSIDGGNSVAKLQSADACAQLSRPAFSLPRGQCLQVAWGGSKGHDQTSAWCLLRRPPSATRDALFALGPHAAFGSIFDAAFSLPINPMTPAAEPLDDTEFKIAVHVRHADANDLGDLAVPAIEKAIAELTSPAFEAAARSCALLVASDRRLTLRLFAGVAKRQGCRLVTSARDEAVRDYSAEHGEDVGEVVLRDVFLLAQGHVLIGTWESSLTVLIQELIAARSRYGVLNGNPYPPMVTYCFTGRIGGRACMRPLPLLTDERSHWFVTFDGNGAARIASSEALERSMEWDEWHAQRDAPVMQAEVAPRPASCQVRLMYKLATAHGQCVLDKTFGCYPGGRLMWVSKGCHGRFQCSDSSVPCGRPRDSRRGLINKCKCEVDAYGKYVWPSQNDTVAAAAANGNGHTRSSFWLAAIISGNTTSARFLATASSAVSSGGLVKHIPAAMPGEFLGMSDMMRELFGTSERQMTKLSPSEIGLVISHKRALKAIAESSLPWGVVFEDDAYLHEALRPSHAGSLLAAAFSAADAFAAASSQHQLPLLYTGSCDPKCGDEDRSAAASAMSPGLLRRGRCHSYCTHSYALSKRHAATFFADVFHCHNGSSGCGRECVSRPCFMDWAMTRYFKRTGVAWIVGGGLRSRFVANHRGVFIQNRSAALGNNFSGTSLKKKFKWSNSSDLWEEERCVKHKALKDALARSDEPLRKVILAVKWSGRLGNLLFQLSALAGLGARLQSIVPTELMTFALSATDEVPVKELFEHFPVTKLVQQGKAESTDFSSAFKSDLAACDACKLMVTEKYANSYDAPMVRHLEEWVAHPPRNCKIGLIELKGYFQSWRYMEKGAGKSLLSTLAEPAQATAREADGILQSVRRGLPSSTGIWRIVGVQVRLGDKLTKLYNRVYAATTWDYYRVAMREVSVRLRQRYGESTKIAFVVTAGGTMGDNSADVAEARKHLASEHVFFSPARDPYVDLAVLRGCDGLVIGGSSLGWWAAYLAKLPEEHVMAPRQLYHPKLSRKHPLVKGFRRADYYPTDWCLLGNDGNSSGAAYCRRSVHIASPPPPPRPMIPSPPPPPPPRATHGQCYLRIKGKCPGHERPQYRVWWKAAPGRDVYDSDFTCAKRRATWQKGCGPGALIEYTLK